MRIKAPVKDFKRWSPAGRKLGVLTDKYQKIYNALKNIKKGEYLPVEFTSKEEAKSAVGALIASSAKKGLTLTISRNHNVVYIYVETSKPAVDKSLRKEK